MLLGTREVNANGVFILSYERRNVPMDQVFSVASEKGFCLIEGHDDLIKIDNLFVFCMSSG